MLNRKFSCRVLFFVFLLLSFTSSAQSLSGVSGNWEAKFTDNNESCILTLHIGSGSFDKKYTLKKGASVLTEAFNGYGMWGDSVQFIFPEESGISILGEINEAYNKIVGKITIKEKVFTAIFIKTGEAKKEEQNREEQIISTDSNRQEIIIENDSGIVNSEEFTLIESEQGQPQKFNYRPLLVWASFWIIIGLFLWLHFRRSKRISNIQQDDPVEVSKEEKETVSKLLPLIRLGRRRNDKRKGLIVSDDSLVLFRKRQGKSIADLHEKTGVENINDCNAVVKSVVIPNDDVENIFFEKISSIGRSRIKIITAGKTFKFTQPAFEMPHLVTALRSKFGLRIQLQRPIRFHACGLLILLAILTLAFNLFLSSNVLSFESSDGSTPWMPGDLLFSLIIIAGFSLLLFIPIIIAILDHTPAGPEKNKAKKKRKDLSHGQPFRSVLFSAFLKLVAIAFFIVFFFLKVYVTLDTEGRKEYPEIAAIPWYFIYFILGLILSLSYSLAQRNPNKLRRKNKMQPILYLRSFADDRETTLNLRNTRSFMMGVDPPYYFLEQYSIGERTWLNRVSKTVIRFLFRFHPLFLLRLMFGNPKETSEQQLGKYLQRYGFFVAIGKPGEKFVTTGASRMYVTNEEWQQTVLDLLQESAFVVLQPSRTKGVWWEVEQVFNKETPEKILLSLVNYHGFQDDYETFRLRMESLFPQRPALPRSIGNESRIVFMTFNANWEPQVYYLKNHWLLSWPFKGTTANLHATLKPFIHSLQPG